ncbi:N-acetylmuramoyl-L-alanine amidase [Jeotgalibaca porci]|uniref:N-acetylmuramoyl-L-alanine amidase n=1 Tax=Jeotgalibaca porci TaxID=1868793 RepID=UPI0035A09FE7
MIIRQDLAPVLPGKNCFGRMNKKKFLVIHQTGNAARGANAQMHATYQINNTKYKDPREASWHWQVDDKEAIQSFTHDVSCYHASDGSGDGNMHSIAIEGCINADGDYKKSVENMARLAAKILKDENISIMNMKQHYDFARDKKNCPAQIRSGKDGIDWNKFVQMVQGYINEKPIVAGIKVEKPKTDKELADEVIKGIHGTGAERKAKLGSRYDAVQKLVDEMFKPKPVPKPVANKTVTDTYKESGTFYPNDTIIVRNAPSTSATIVARYYKGEHVKYHTVHLKNGYVWLQYTRGNGQQAHIPCRTYSNGKYGTLWGTIK